MVTNFRFGILAEYFVMFMYNIQFYSVLHHRMRNIAGEIDLVCQKGKLLVFIEVKARSSKFDDILCTTSQQKRIRRAAEIFIQKNTKYIHYKIK